MENKHSAAPFKSVRPACFCLLALLLALVFLASCSGIKTLELYFSELTFYVGDNSLPLLEKLILHEGLRKIDAILECPLLTSLMVQASVREINSRTFEGCRLSQLHFKSVTPPKMQRSYLWQEHTCTLYVPQGAKANYVSAGEPWTLFKEIVEEPAGGTD